MMYLLLEWGADDFYSPSISSAFSSAKVLLKLDLWSFYLLCRFTEEEVDEMLRGAPVDGNGNFNYVEFTRILKHGTKEE